MAINKTGLTNQEILLCDCSFCGRMLRLHCRARLCRYEFRMCYQGILQTIKGASDVWEGQHHNGICISCRQDIRHHYEHRVMFGIQAAGMNVSLAPAEESPDIYQATEYVLFPFPSAWIGCPDHQVIWI